MAFGRSSSVIPKLLISSSSDDVNNTKFLLWRARVGPFLEAVKLWDHVSGATIPCPPETLEKVTSDGVKWNVPNLEFDEWMTRDESARKWLLTTISNDMPLKKDLGLLSTSKEIWDCLNHTFPPPPPPPAAADDALISASGGGDDHVEPTTERTTEKDEEVDHMEKPQKHKRLAASAEFAWMSSYQAVTEDKLIVSNKRGSYIISSRKLGISAEENWEWISIPESRFPEVVKLDETEHHHHFGISGKVERDMLSPKTAYVVNLVYKLTPLSEGMGSPFLEATVWEETENLSRWSFSGASGRKEGKKTFVCLQHPPPEGDDDMEEFHIETPRPRTDGWLEVTLGHFTTTITAGAAKYVNVFLTAEHEKKLWVIPITLTRKNLIVEGLEFKTRK